jgi:lipid-binding SYLF domain-containing protein
MTSPENPMRAAVFVLVSILLVSAAPGARAGEEENKRVENAVRVLKEVMEAPDKAVPRDLLQNAHAIAVVPDVIKAGLVIGGRHGSGLIAVKTREGTWSNPAFVSMTGGSIGFQAGVSSTDVILVFRTQRGVDSIVHGKFTLGADASAAAGPVGRSATASTDAQLKAEIYSYSRARGLFAGAALDGTAITIDNDANQAAYGDGVTTRRIFDGGVSNVPNPIVDFRDLLEEYTTK